MLLCINKNTGAKGCLSDFYNFLATNCKLQKHKATIENSLKLKCLFLMDASLKTYKLMYMFGVLSSQHAAWQP